MTILNGKPLFNGISKDTAKDLSKLNWKRPQSLSCVTNRLKFATSFNQIVILSVTFKRHFLYDKTIADRKTMMMSNKKLFSNSNTI